MNHPRHNIASDLRELADCSEPDAAAVLNAGAATIEDLIAQRDALKAPLLEMHHEIQHVDAEAGGLLDSELTRAEFDAMYSRAEAALAIPNPEAKP